MSTLRSDLSSCLSPPLAPVFAISLSWVCTTAEALAPPFHILGAILTGRTEQPLDSLLSLHNDGGAHRDVSSKGDLALDLRDRCRRP
jgi:hypothetical protein